MGFLRPRKCPVCGSRMYTRIDKGTVTVECPNSHREHASAAGGDTFNEEAKGSNEDG